MPTSTKPRGASSDGRGVQSVEIGARLLFALAHSGAPMMLKDLAAAAELVPAQAHPYLVSFRQLQMVEKDSRGRYRLGPFALQLGMSRMSAVDPMEVAREAMFKLSRETGMSVILSVWGSFGPTIVTIVEGAGNINMSSRVGTVYSLSGTASGRIFAAYLLPNQLKGVQASERRNQENAMRVGNPVAMSQDELKTVRSEGFAMPPTPVVPGILAIAAPVFSIGKQLQFSIALIGRGDQNQSDKSRRMREALLRMTQILSRDLGHF